MTEGPTWRGLALSILGRQAERIHLHVPGVLEDAGPKPLREVRVALRRTALVLRAFAPALGRKPAEELRERLQGMRRSLGPLRELDLLIPKLEAQLQALEAPLEVSVPILSQLAVRRVLCRQEVIAQLLKPSVVADMGGLDAPSRWPSKGKGDRLLEPAAPGLVWVHAQPLHRIRKVAILDLSDEERHDIRLQVKRLRDLLLFLYGLTPAAEDDALVLLKELQDRFGRLEDLGNGIRIIKGLADGLSKPARRNLKQVLLAERQERRALLQDLDALWREQRRFWSRFRTPDATI